MIADKAITRINDLYGETCRNCGKEILMGEVRNDLYWKDEWMDVFCHKCFQEVTP